LSGSPDGVGVGARLVAFALDALLVFVVAGPLVAFLGRGSAPILFVVVPALGTIFCWHRYGATPGKITFSARIVDARSGGRPSLPRLATRSSRPHRCFSASPGSRSTGASRPGTTRSRERGLSTKSDR
jgi:hypothetical protein